MSEIALYNLFKRIPDATDHEIEKAVTDFAHSKDAATKTDIADLKTEIAELETRLVKHQIKLTGFTIIFLGSLMTLLELFS